MERGSKHTDESRAKMRQAALSRPGVKHRAETKARIGESHRRRAKLVRELLERHEAEQATA